MSLKNKVLLTGHLGASPNYKIVGDGIEMATFRMATTEKYKDQEKTEWHNIVAYKKLAEIVNQHLRKGSQVQVEGKLTYKESDGKFFTNIVINELNILTWPDQPKPESRKATTPLDENTNQFEPEPKLEDTDELPF